MATPTSKDTAVINDTTKRLEMTVYGEQKTLDRLFSHSNIEIIYMDGVVNLNRSYYFEFMNALKAAVFPDATTITSYVFWNNAAGIPVPGIDFHKKIDFPTNTPFKLDAGANIILRSAEMCTTGFTASSWGVSASLVFYVPQALLDAYREANNWNTFGASRILPIEGSRYENVDWWKIVS